MIRHRAGIVEGEDVTKSRLKLRTTVAEFAPSEEDQRWIEPRLAAVIGLAPMPPGDRSELFAALRAFFQAVAANGSVLMVFEDLHWADDGLLDFVEELVERTTNHPILVLCLARPELLERRPDWAAARKRSLTMHLSRLDEASMRLLVAGLAPGMPQSLTNRIADRTAGIPLHAVEFVRMLLNTGELIREGNEFRFVGSDDQLSIPDSVSAIIGARLDRLDADDLAAIQDAAVLGLAFTLADLAAVRGVATEEIERRLRDLVRREILELEEDPRSPERGQYRFVQSLIREVAYGRLSKSERVSRHLEVAKRFEALEDDELAGVIASHYADAAAADPGSAELRDRARIAVVVAADRAATLHSDKQAADLYLRAIEMTEDPADADRLRLQAMASMLDASLFDEPVAMGHSVLERARAEGDSNLEILAATALAKILASGFEADKAVEVILPVYEATPQTPDVTWARLAGETSRALMLANRSAESVAVADAAIPVMEDLDLSEELLETLVNKGSSLANSGRWIEGSTILRGAADLAGLLDLTIVRVRAINNLLSATVNDNQMDGELMEEIGILIERLGNQAWSERLSYVRADEHMMAGRLDEAMVEIRKVLDSATWDFIRDSVEHHETRIGLLRNGVDDEGFARLMAFNDKYMTSDDPQLLQNIAFGTQWDLMLTEDYAGVLAIAADMADIDIAYPTIVEAGILAAAITGDGEALGRFTDHITAEYPRGRASRGLIDIARAFGAALGGDTEEAITLFATADDVWSDVVDPTRVAFARAAMAILLGPDEPMAVGWGEQARDFFAEHGMKSYLDGIMQRVPDAAHGAELAG
jgi:tetratricopeptide (TPR) repeat protein